MDLLKEIRTKVQLLPDDYRAGCVEVVRHLEQCERLVEIGRKQGPEFFNDIIYRSNQAFEGALKEAYRTLADKDPDKITLHALEEFFTSNAVVRPRIVQLMNNYRREWRNPSTHDYSLKFDESEGILAIASVSAFFLALLSQVADKAAIRSTEQAARQAAEKAQSAPSLADTDLPQAVASVAKSVLQTIIESDSLRFSGREVELLFAQALASANPGWLVTQGMRVPTGGGALIEADMVVTGPEQSVPIEIKIVAEGNKTEARILGVDHLARLMRAGKFNTGVFVAVPATIGQRKNARIIERFTRMMPIDIDEKAVGIIEVNTEVEGGER